MYSRKCTFENKFVLLIYIIAPILYIFRRGECKNESLSRYSRIMMRILRGDMQRYQAICSQAGPKMYGTKGR